MGLKQGQKENYSNQLTLVFIETGSKGELQQQADIGLHWNRVKRRITATSWHWSSLKQGQKENYSNQLTLVFIETGSKGELQQQADIGLHWNRVKRRITATSWHWSSLKQGQKENYSNQLTLVFTETGSKGELQQPADIGLHWNRVKRRITATSWHWSSLKQCQKENYCWQLRLVFTETDMVVEKSASVKVAQSTPYFIN